METVDGFFESYALLWSKWKHKVHKLSHLNPPSQKNNSYMLGMPMFKMAVD